MWSRDRLQYLTYNGGLLDLTGDGYLEKAVCFWEQDTVTKRFYQRAQIFRMRHREKLKLLLDVTFYESINAPPSRNEKEPPDFMFEIRASGYPRPYLIQLNSIPTKEKVVFIWSDAKQRFVAKGEKSQYWRVLFPSESQHIAELWTCRINPDIREDKAGECPLCGMELVPVSRRPDAIERDEPDDQSD